jgi:prepilin signal peptidase PulO-like enzyme (type II secretory pathway)
MDNGAYEKYRQENPVVNTPLSTYEDVQIFVDHLTPVEQAVCGVALVLAVYAVIKVIGKLRKKKSQDE